MYPVYSLSFSEFFLSYLIPLLALVLVKAKNVRPIWFYFIYFFFFGERDI